MAKRQSNCQCSPDGSGGYCQWCTMLAERAGIVLTSPAPTYLHPHPGDEPEGAFMERLRKLAVDDLKLLFYHPYSSKKSTPGWPDCAIIHPHGGVLRLWELKIDNKDASPAQRRWLEALQRVTAVDARVVRPRDWQCLQHALKENRDVAKGQDSDR